MGLLDKLIDDGSSDIPSNQIKTLDKAWLTSSYLVEINDLSDDDRPNAYWSNAYLKYTDTSLGGNYGINTKYGYTPSADVPIAGRMSGREPFDIMSESMDYGMGRQYSEAIDDNEQILFIEMGDPKFNSLLSMAINAMDYGTSVVANSGRSLAAYYAGRAIGSVVAVTAVFMAFPLWGAALFLGGLLASKLISAGSDFYYYKLDPSMYKYWRAVNTCTNQLFTELGLTVPELMDTPTEGQLGLPVAITSEFVSEINELLPGLITEGNYVDVFAVANRIQVLTNSQMALEQEMYNTSTTYTFADKVSRPEVKHLTSWLSELHKIYKTSGKITEATTGTQTDNGGEITSTEGSDIPNATANKPSDTLSKASTKADQSVVIPTKEIEEKKDWLDEVVKYSKSASEYGAGSANFRVEYTGAVTETFSSSVKDIPIKDTINNVSRKAKDIRFSVAGGNIISDNVDKALKYAGDFAMGSLESVTFGLSNIFTALMGSGYFDVPKMWDDSTFEYQKHTFKMRLGGPYGHPLSQVQDMYIPLFMLICAAATQSVGKAGYTSPMLCKPFIKGIMAPNLALMDSLTIERGVGSMGYDKRGRPLAIDVSFSFIVLDDFFSMPVEAGVFGAITSALDDASPLARYIQLLGGRDYYTTKYAAPKVKNKYANLKKGMDAFISPAALGTAIGSSIGGSIVGGLLTGFTLPSTQLNK